MTPDRNIEVEYQTAYSGLHTALRRMESSVEAFRLRAMQYLMVSASRAILVVDDHSGDRRMVVSCLEAADYDVLEAEDVRNARTILRRVPDIGIVILDLMLPDGDGWILAEEIQRPIRVVFISGAADDNLNRLARRAGAVGALKKPPDPKELLNVVRMAFGEET